MREEQIKRIIKRNQDAIRSLHDRRNALEGKIAKHEVEIAYYQELLKEKR
jgi:hypothetical protein